MGDSAVGADSLSGAMEGLNDQIPPFDPAPLSFRNDLNIKGCSMPRRDYTYNNRLAGKLFHKSESHCTPL